ncbi:hypothetical protein N6H14_08960 [Paenibacillus sp. CC-CFT747]|nr:hypothetical protein N6H14_08960 [Paenibacillus sp. CC-CFT747]
MNDNRPEWYGRAAKDPFRSGGFTPKMADSVRQSIHRPHSRPKGLFRIAGERLRFSPGYFCMG